MYNINLLFYVFELFYSGRSSTGTLHVRHPGHFRLSPLVRVELLLHGLQPGLHVLVLGLLELRGRPGPGGRRRGGRPAGRRHHHHAPGGGGHHHVVVGGRR